jgi:tetratricopeptide (TPR) repeat protein
VKPRSRPAAITAAIAISLSLSSLPAAAGRQTPAPLTVNAWVALYERDQIDATIRLRALSDKDAYRLRDDIMGAAKSWPKGAPPLRDPLLSLAALAVELESTRIDDNDWRGIPGHNSGDYAVARAAEVIERRARNDAAARAWWRVALTLTEINHDNRSMFKPKYMTHPPVRFDFLPRALAMFPGDIDFRYCEARLHASSVSALLELASPQNGVEQARSDGVAIGYGYQGALSRSQQDELEQARPLLAALTADPAVGAGARFWFGYLQWITGDLDGGHATISALISDDTAAGVDVHYTAAVLLGYMNEALGRIDDAEKSFRSALRFRPKSQSASLALAALLHRAGSGEEADQLVRESLSPRGGGDDPWRLLPYGDLAKLPSQMEVLRRAVGGAAK